tara:strand:- start:74 stop:337 length:264 start_codon:yes stop_codon:yes gene_type:complete
MANEYGSWPLEAAAQKIRKDFFAARLSNSGGRSFFGRRRCTLAFSHGIQFGNQLFILAFRFFTGFFQFAQQFTDTIQTLQDHRHRFR